MTGSPPHLVVIIDGYGASGCRAAVAAAGWAEASGCALTAVVLLNPTWLTGLIPLAGIPMVSSYDLELDLMTALTKELNRFGVPWMFYPVLGRPDGPVGQLLRERPARAVVSAGGPLRELGRAGRLARRLGRRFGVPVHLGTPRIPAGTTPASGLRESR